MQDAPHNLLLLAAESQRLVPRRCQLEQLRRRPLAVVHSDLDPFEPLGQDVGHCCCQALTQQVQRLRDRPRLATDLAADLLRRVLRQVDRKEQAQHDGPTRVD
eukprot:3664094-Pyramimonas_sp.AAC.1